MRNKIENSRSLSGFSCFLKNVFLRERNKVQTFNTLAKSLRILFLLIAFYEYPITTEVFSKQASDLYWMLTVVETRRSCDACFGNLLKLSRL